MKVLFAVQDEQISTKIVKEYQRKYKEIISYKNVYYFNAIITELQRNKTYDRIVIDEELDEVNSTSYAQKDKFIFDKLDNISDEAINSKGSDIPIILICSERRTKSQDIFVKLFGIGIYNAIIGNDRSTEEVCKLIERPRSKKQAKIYYKIDSEEVQYRHETENDVSEEEMQNILMHFKKLGKNEEKYVDSFSKILSQYNNEQMKIIIKILPANVKKVLEETSPEYQQLASVSKNIKERVSEKKEENGTFEKLLGSDQNKSRISKPIVVPTTMEKNTVKKLTVKKPVMQYNEEEFEIDDLEEIDTVEDNNVIPEVEEIKPKRRGRPKKNPEQDEVTPKETVTPKKRGRPRKVDVAKQNDDTKLTEEIEKLETSIQKKENTKTPIFDEDEEEITELPGFDDEEEEITELPGFDDEEEEVTELPGFDNEDEEEIAELPGFDDEDEEEIAELPGFDDEDEEEITELPGFDNEDEEEITELPGFDDEDEEEVTELPGFDNEDEEEEVTELPGFDDEDEVATELPGFNSDEDIGIYNNKNTIPKQSEEYQKITQVSTKQYDDINLDNLLSADNKIVAFVGTSKNGTSFIVNNVAQYLSMNGINTAILDTTKNKNSYYIYTKNEEELRNKAANSINNLLRGNGDGIKVNQNLSVYTAVPGQYDEDSNIGPILETLVKNHSAILIDCDYNTPLEYFDKAQEIYLVQSMDVLTIQPLTAFLRELKSKNILDQSKIRILINKVVNLKGISSKNIVGGMAFYNDPEMSFMTELFDRNTVKYVEIPFNEEVYALYLEGIVECEISVNRYPRDFDTILKEISNMVYPLLPNSNSKKTEKRKRGYEYSTGFSSSVNNTLNNMKNRY